MSKPITSPITPFYAGYEELKSHLGVDDEEALGDLSVDALLSDRGINRYVKTVKGDLVLHQATETRSRLTREEAGAHVAALAKLASKELQDPLEDSHFHLSMLMACLYSDNVEIRESAGDAIKALWTKDHAALLAWEAGEIAWHMHGSGRKLDDCLVNLIARGKNAIPPGNWSEDDKQDFKTCMENCWEINAIRLFLSSAGKNGVLEKGLVEHKPVEISTGNLKSEEILHDPKLPPPPNVPKIVNLSLKDARVEIVVSDNEVHLPPPVPSQKGIVPPPVPSQKGIVPPPVPQQKGIVPPPVPKEQEIVPPVPEPINRVSPKEPTEQKKWPYLFDPFTVGELNQCDDLPETTKEMDIAHYGGVLTLDKDGNIQEAEKFKKYLDMHFKNTRWLYRDKFLVFDLFSPDQKKFYHLMMVNGRGAIIDPCPSEDLPLDQIAQDTEKLVRKVNAQLKAVRPTIDCRVINFNSLETDQTSRDQAKNGWDRWGRARWGLFNPKAPVVPDGPYKPRRTINMESIIYVRPPRYDQGACRLQPGTGYCGPALTAWLKAYGRQYNINREKNDVVENYVSSFIKHWSVRDPERKQNDLEELSRSVRNGKLPELPGTDIDLVELSEENLKISEKIKVAPVEAPVLSRIAPLELADYHYRNRKISDRIFYAEPRVLDSTNISVGRRIDQDYTLKSMVKEAKNNPGKVYLQDVYDQSHGGYFHVMIKGNQAVLIDPTPGHYPGGLIDSVRKILKSMVWFSDKLTTYGIDICDCIDYCSNEYQGSKDHWGRIWEKYHIENNVAQVCNISSNQVEEERKQLLQHGTGYLGVSLHKYLLEDEESFKDEDPIAIFKQFAGDWDESLLKEKQLFLSDPRMQEPSVIDYDEDGQNETNISTAPDSNTYVGDEKENERNQVEERNRDLRISPFLMNAPHEYHKLDINKISNIKYHHQIVVRTDYDNWVDTLRGNIIEALKSPIIMGGRMTILDLYDELNQRYVHMLIKGKEVVIVDPCPVDSGDPEKNRLPSRLTDEIMRNIDANLVSRRVLINYSSNEVQQSGTGGGWATLIDYNKQDQENGISYEVREEGLGSKPLEPMLQEGAGYFGIALWKYLIENSKSDTLASEELVLDFIKHWNGIDQEKRESFLDQLDNMEIGNDLVEQWLEE